MVSLSGFTSTRASLVLVSEMGFRVVLTECGILTPAHVAHWSMVLFQVDQRLVFDIVLSKCVSVSEFLSVSAGPKGAQAEVPKFRNINLYS